MKKERIVIALGGNALGNNPQEQLELVKETAKAIVALAKEGYEIVIGHGNGPQVGMINLAMDYAANGSAGTPAMPFAECGAMSQGYIGYHLQQAIGDELKRQKVARTVVSIVTQVVVSKDDSAFSNPTKPIGMFYSKEEADKLKAAKPDFVFTEDAGRGYRRVVPSPQPVAIIEKPVIEDLIACGHIVITVGGGGIPVLQTEAGLCGVDAVIDKDKSSAKLAADVKADKLVILTAVDQVCINFNKPNQQALSSLTVAQAETYIGEGHFAKGSMLPKVEACMQFVRNHPQGQAIITSLANAGNALKGGNSTVITA
ncbi:MAG: carbamate kinase [Treponema sp.]